MQSRSQLFSQVAKSIGGPVSEKCGPRLYGCSLGGSSQELLLLLLLQHTVHIEIHDNWCSNEEGRVIQHNFRYPQQHAPLTSIHPPCSIHIKKNGTPRQTYRTYQTQWMDMCCDACAVPDLVIFIHWRETKLPLFWLFQFGAWTGPSQALWLLYVPTQNMNLSQQNMFVCFAWFSVTNALNIA
jgi:hypothetical protein